MIVLDGCIIYIVYQPLIFSDYVAKYLNAEDYRNRLIY